MPHHLAEKKWFKNMSFSCRIILAHFFLVKKTQNFLFPLLRFGTEKMHFCSNGPYPLKRPKHSNSIWSQKKFFKWQLYPGSRWNLAHGKYKTRPCCLCESIVFCGAPHPCATEENCIAAAKGRRLP